MTLAQILDPAACVGQFGNWQYPIWKHQDDLARYAAVIERSRPEVVIETGTNTGHSALWFADQGLEVITIDVEDRVPPEVRQASVGRVTTLRGSSIDPRIYMWARDLARDRRTMVSLDSDHSAGHVFTEIRSYAPAVSPGCHLVVEDGVIAWLDEPAKRAHSCYYYGTVLEAIDRWEPDPAMWERDREIEALTPATMHPAGWWRRREPQR